jgi:hypothetical protein
LQQFLLGLLAMGVFVVWLTWLEPRSTYGAVAAVAVAVPAIVGWEVRRYRQGRLGRERLWEHTICAVLLGGALVLEALGRPATVPVGALLLALVGWNLVRGYRNRRERELAHETRRDARRAAIRLLTKSPPGAAAANSGDAFLNY